MFGTGNIFLHIALEKKLDNNLLQHCTIFLIVKIYIMLILKINAYNPGKQAILPLSAVGLLNEN